MQGGAEQKDHWIYSLTWMKGFCWIFLLPGGRGVWGCVQAKEEERHLVLMDCWLSIKAGGEVLVIWLMNIRNATVELDR